MLKVAISAFLRNAAAVLVGRRGAVTDQARKVGCSRQTIYNHAHQLQQRFEEGDQRLLQVEAERHGLREEAKGLHAQHKTMVLIDEDQLRRFAVVGQAMGISLRQEEELLGTLLPPERVPDHTQLGRWTAEAGRRAGEVLAVLDPLCAAAVKDLCLDEIFFGG